MAGMDSWDYIEFGLYDSMAGGYQPLYNDRQLQALYDAALFENTPLGSDTGYTTSADRGEILNALRDYLWEEYGVDFDDVFDWESYREAYDRA